MTDEQIIKALECCTTQSSCDGCPYEDADEECYKDMKLHKDALDLINRLQAEKEALIAGQETLQKALADKINESEKQSQNFKVLVSDHRTLQQSFDNLKGLYEEQKARVKKAKEKCIYFAKEVQKARAETERVTELAAGWKDAAYKYADLIDSIKSEVTEQLLKKIESRLSNNTDISNVQYQSIIFDISEACKEKVGDAE